MKFNEYLKKARLNVKLSQVEVSEILNVTSNTIQNWEKDILPDKSYWGDIIQTYKLNKNDFLNSYGNSVIPNEKNEKENIFPDFLFPKNICNILNNISLTTEEQELLGLLCIYENKCLLPYEYIQNIGSFKIFNIENNLENKLGIIKEDVINYLINNHEYNFTINNVKPEFYLEICKKLFLDENDEECLMTFKDNKLYRFCEENYYSILINIFNILDIINQNDNNYKVGRLVDDIIEPNKEMLEEEFNIFFTSSYYKEKTLKLKPIHYKYIKLIDKECKEEFYISLKNKYEEDIAFYNSHKDMLDYEPKKPKYIADRYLIMIEDGIKLLNWYNNYIKQN